MKHFIACLFLVSAAFSAQAQWGKVRGSGNITTETRSTGDYDHVAVGGPFDVTLIAGTEGKINIEADDNLLQYIITEVKGDKLKIYVKNGVNIRPSGKIKATVPFKDLEGASLAGSGTMVNESPITASSFDCAVAGSGNLILDLKADDIQASVAGSGNLRLSGRADKIEMHVAGSGNVRANDLTAKIVEANVAGSGDIDFDCDDCDLTARVSGSGDIGYTGNTTREDVKVSGSGKIRKH
ncbi:MAG: DUF2807 domain-containing protein [Cytophagaceae bacterium]|nr:DUF2807 domain-containing protein [Cytophagaceae bacterium]